MRNLNRLEKRGSVLVGSVILAIIGAMVIGGYLSMASNEFRLAQRTMQLQSAMNIAEAGLEEGINSVNLESWSGWTAVGSNAYFKSVGGIAFTDSRTAEFKIYVENYDTLLILASEGKIINADGSEIVKQIRVHLARSSVFANGMLAKRTIDFSGNNVSFDSYDSNQGLWSSTNKLDDGAVSSLSVDNGAFDAGNADVWGYVATGGGEPDVGPNGSIMGEDSTQAVDPDRISKDFYANLWDVSVPTGTVEDISYIVDYTEITSDSIGSTGIPSNPEVYHLTSYSMSGTDQLVIEGPTVIIVDENFSVTGGAGITIEATNDAALELYAAGDVTISGIGLLNATLDPLAFQLWGTAPNGTSQDISVKGNGDTAGVIYAPNTDLAIVGQGAIAGAAVTSTINVAGGAESHYDVQLAGFTRHSTYHVSRWRELRGAEQLDFTDTSALASNIKPL